MIFRPNDDLRHFRASFWERISPLEAAILIVGMIVGMFAIVAMIDGWLCGWPCK